MAQPSVLISLAAEFVGKKAFKEADSATTMMTKNVKKLAGALGLAFSTRAVVAYGKASVKAFAQDEAAANRLSRAVENLGIGFANPAIADYIGKLEKSAAIADDILRPAFQGLLTTTGSLVQSQKLLNDAITISRASGIDLATVSEDLAKGYVGVTRGLIKYNTGLTRAELTSKSFNEILGVILKRSAGAAEDYLGSTAYSLDTLTIATGNASEIIGGGLVDAFAAIGGGTEASDAAYAIENIASALAKVTAQTGRTIGVIPTLLQNLKKLPKEIFQGFAGAQIGVNVIPPVKKAEAKLTVSEKRQQEILAKLEKDSLKRERERLGLKTKQLATDKAKALLAKGELALLKGEEVFDIEKIQNEAALKSQAEALGKATNGAQVLQIANDTARLNVKKSILALEDAMATKDEAAIKAATAKLNADLGILAALTGQDAQLTTIKSILDTLKPKDLINLDNLKEALRLLKEIAGGTGGGTGGGTAGGAKLAGAAPVMPKSLIPIKGAGGVRPQKGFTGAELQYFEDASEYAFSGMLPSGSSSSSGSVTIVNNFGVVGDPNAAAELMNQTFQDAIDRGTLRVIA
jgi:hypothetical protein